MNRTGIEYLDLSWNPIAMRCTPVSEGCTNCWHLRMANRLAANPTFPDNVRAAYAGEGPPVLVEERLRKPLKRKKPAIIGVQFMGDLFHQKVDSLILKRDIWNVMVDCPQHTFLLLTKRPKRMLEVYGNHTPWSSNIWVGVTAENQKCADERIPVLLQIPAAVRFLSCEPLLSAIDLRHWLGWWNSEEGPRLDGQHGYPNDISWTIVGGESGPRARPMNPEWARDIRDQCLMAGVSYFHKQNGEWVVAEAAPPTALELSDNCKSFSSKRMYHFPDGAWGVRVGKKEAGHLLDGREWHQLPVKNTD